MPVKRIYQIKAKSIPVLKTELGGGSFSILAQTSSEKAKIFNEQFYANTLIPTDFPDNSVHLDSIKSF